MSEQGKKNQAKSVAAFLFMPQFSLSFQHFAFIMPVFIRSIAVAFEQAGLLPKNHPAIRYGIEGVRKYGFFELMGEAWYTLRRTHANPYQWGLFAAVALMTAAIIGSLVSTLFSLSGLLVGSAQAQLFDHPNGATDLASVPGDQSAMFSRNIPDAGAHADYGIMILDKMLRQGANGIGGPLQNAVGSLMQIYNTGVMAIAALILFWIVVSVVVDTAKTGQIGGGRHNMVWAPIRIVFALGLLIPLGNSGFSSGQFAVMKLAEWGSNFGTRAWVRYVEMVASGSNLMATYGQQNPTGLVSQYVQMWVCRVAYNGVQNVTLGGNVPNEQKVQQMPAVGMADQGTQKYTFTNSTGVNLCGSVTYPTGNDPALKLSDNPPNGQPDRVAQAVTAYKVAVLGAYRSLLTDGGNGPGILGAKAKEFACGFVAQHITNADGNALAIDCGGDGGGSCGAGPAGSGQYPRAQCIAELVSQFNNEVRQQSAPALSTLTNLTSQREFLNDIQARGWPGMGMWYHRIEQMNAAVASMAVPPVTIAGGDPTRGANADSSLLAKTMIEVMGQYKNWWLNMPARPDVSKPTPSPYSSADSTHLEAPISATGIKDIVASADGASPAAFVNAFVALISGSKSFIFDLIDPRESNTYPLAQLAAVGDSMFNTSLWIYGTLTVGEIVAAGFATGIGGKVAGFLPFNPGAAIQALISSPLTAWITTLAGVLFMAGATLKFYIPLLPFLRVAHAVLTWMISVFEAVAMVPIAAIAHLSTQGEGLAGNARNAWILWLNILMRPVLTVIGFVAAMLIFNIFLIYFHDSFARGMMGAFTGDAPGFWAQIAYAIIYVFVIYTVANSTFKLLDLMPSAMMKYLGGSADQSFDHDHSGALAGAGQLVQSLGSRFGQSRREFPARGDTEDKGKAMVSEGDKRST